MSYSERQLKQAMTWFVRLQAEDCSAQDEQLFATWLSKSAAHSAAYAKAEQLWGGLDAIKAVDNIPALTAARLAKPTKSRTTSLLAFLLASTLLGSVVYSEYHSETLHYATQRGERQHLVLADNSQIDLNTDTQLTVKISLLHRHIALQRGEALFTVQHERWRDFSVQANRLTIRDIGTQFNVHLKSDSVTVAVLAGEVELNDGETIRGLSLSAGHQRVYSMQTGLSPAENATKENVAAWLNGHLVFNHAPLQQVTAELERYHHIQFVIANPALAQQTLSGTFEANNLEPFLHAIEPVLGIQAKRQGSTILLQRVKKK